MIGFAIAVLAMGSSSFYDQMNLYLACLQRDLPANMSSLDQDTRIRLYRAAAARCQPQRASAIEAAVRNREPGTSETQARNQAAQIIDDLDPTPRQYGH